MEYLKEVKETVMAIVPKEAEVTSVDLEGPEIAVYTKNPKVFHDNEDYVRAIAHQLKKKVNIRADKSMLVEEKDAREKITRIVPEEAKISDIQFMEAFSEVVIEALKPGLVIGKGGMTTKEIILQTGWTPRILRSPTSPSEILKGIRHHLVKYASERKKILQETAKKIYSEKPSPSWIRLTPLGGFRQVGRSCIMLETRRTKILMDCGINVAAQASEDAFPFLDAIRFPINELDAVVLSHAHMDHCLPPDSLILTENGYKKIDDINVGEKVISMDWDSGKQAIAKCTGKTRTFDHKKVLKLRTAYSSVEASPNHRFFTVQNLELKELEAAELKQGMLLPSNILNKPKTRETEVELDTNILYDTRRKDKFTLPKILGPELAELVGYYVGDGHISSEFALRITDASVQLLEHHKSIISEIFGYSPAIRHHSDKRKNAHILEIANIKIIRFLKKNFPEAFFETREKRIPQKIIAAPSIVQKAFLKGIADAEGTSGKEIKATSYSKKLLEDLQYLFSLHGIPAGINADNSIHIRTKYAIKQFSEKVGFSSNKKETKLEYNIDSFGGTNFEKQDLLPITPQDLRKILKEAGMLGRVHNSPNIAQELPTALVDMFRRKSGYCTRKTVVKLVEILRNRISSLENMSQTAHLYAARQAISLTRQEISTSTGLKYYQVQDIEEGHLSEKNKASLIAAFIKEKISSTIELTQKNVNAIEKLLATQVIWEKITNIESFDNPYDYLVDIEVEKFHNFITGNIVVHNCGFIPYLFKLGYRGPVYLTEPTRDLAALLLFDYLDILAKDNKEAPYSERDVKEMLKYCIVRDYREVTDIAPDMRLTFHNAAHVLGSASVHLHIGEGAHNLVYSADIKYGFTRLFNNVDINYPRLETLIVESTYGGKDDIQTAREETEARFLRVIQETVNQGGSILVPVFAVGRAQELQLVIENFYRKGLIDPEVKVYVDGMTKESSAIHTAYPEYLRTAVQKRVLQNDSPFTSDIFEVAKPEDRDAITERGKCIILASSGMLTGGASVQYFYRLAENPVNTIAFVGYQGEGSLGRKVVSGVKSLPITDNGGRTRKLNINMRVERFDGFSGHSDRMQLSAYVRNLKPKPKRILTDHGEAEKCVELAKHFAMKFGISSQAIRNLDSVRLK